MSFPSSKKPKLAIMGRSAKIIKATPLKDLYQIQEMDEIDSPDKLQRDLPEQQEEVSPLSQGDRSSEDHIN